MRLLSDSHHLTATDRRAIAAMRANGWASAHSARIRYAMAPSPDHAGAHCVTIRKPETDDYGRTSDRVRRVLVAF